MLEISRKIEFLAETSTANRDFKKAFGSATVVAWLFCSHDNNQHRSPYLSARNSSKYFFHRLNIAQKEGHANYRKDKAETKLRKNFTEKL
jgi:hypothetical protein